MIIIVAAISFILGLITWNYLVNSSSETNLQIPASNNITYSPTNIKAITPSEIINTIDADKNRPIMLHFYTLWCQICKRQFPVINEMARKFQNTDLQVIAIAVDNNITEKKLVNYLEYYQHIYFQPTYLAYSDSLTELLKEKSINYQNRIPYTVMIGRDGDIISSWTGYKDEKYFSKKIIRSLLPKSIQKNDNQNHNH